MPEPFLLPADAIESMLARAADIGKTNGFLVDYSRQSVRDIDKVLNSFHKEYINEQEHSEEALSGIGLSLGIYVGESMRHALRDASLLWWYGVPKTGGSPTPFLKKDEAEVYPMDWIYKQIADGKSESIVKKYDYFLKAFKKLS